MNFICAIIVSCGLGIVSKTGVECTKINENHTRYIVDCSSGVEQYCENSKTSKSYKHVLVDKEECVLIRR